jgi:hypothetical protein
MPTESRWLGTPPKPATCVASWLASPLESGLRRSEEDLHLVTRSRIMQDFFAASRCNNSRAVCACVVWPALFHCDNG